MNVMGIDGGGSTVRVVIRDGDRTVCDYTQPVGVNPKQVGYDVSNQRLLTAVRQTLADARLTAADIAAVGIGLAGAGTDWDARALAAFFPHAPVVYGRDLKIALVGARGEPNGVVVLAGTGSAAFGMNRSGHEVQVGGLGYLLDDVGSGYWLGKEALRRSLRAIDGLAPPTALQERIAHERGFAVRNDWLIWVYDAGAASPAVVAGFAPLVLELADAGDAVAQAIVNEGAAELARLCEAVLAQLAGLTQQEVAFAGGLLTALNPLSREHSVSGWA